MILSDFAADCRTRGLSEGSIRNYSTGIEMFQGFLELRGKDPLNADRLDIRAFIEDRRKQGNTSKTIEYRLAALSAYYDWLIFEGQIIKNPIHEARGRYIQRYKSDGEQHTHRILSVEEAAALVDALMDIRDRAIMLMLFKTGIRKNELLSLDVDSVNWQDQSITLKQTKKRSNRKVFFDDEAGYYLRKWLFIREGRDNGRDRALFVNSRGERGTFNLVNYTLRKAALQAGLHDLESDRLEDHFSAHACRHWFTTHLLRSGMRREFVQWLRGDRIKEAIDIYYHINPEDVRREYLAHIPQLGV